MKVKLYDQFGLCSIKGVNSVDKVELSIDEDEYVRITCKDGSHMVLSDVKEIYCNRIRRDEYELH